MILNDLKFFLEKIDHYRDEVFFVFVKPYWPRKISPNQITWVRIVIGLALFILLFFLDVENKALVVSLFVFGVFTDLLDGSVARGLNKVTEFGAMLDHLADWILIIPIAIYGLYKLQKWLLLFLLIVEVLNFATLIFTKSKNIETKANIFGKTRMVMLCVVFGAILIVWPANTPLFFIYLAWASLLFTILSILVKILDLKNRGHIKNKFVNKHPNKVA